ncbi:unnamed protein product, partial [Amoebophrya sp. A120]|eukprot:GSA120T00000656001.1
MSIKGDGKIEVAVASICLVASCSLLQQVQQKYTAIMFGASKTTEQRLKAPAAAQVGPVGKTQSTSSSAGGAAAHHQHTTAAHHLHQAKQVGTLDKLASRLGQASYFNDKAAQQQEFTQRQGRKSQKKLVEEVGDDESDFGDHQDADDVDASRIKTLLQEDSDGDRHNFSVGWSTTRKKAVIDDRATTSTGKNTKNANAGERKGSKEQGGAAGAAATTSMSSSSSKGGARY